MQNKDGVMIRCSDNQTHRGDILVGADGAHSAVRQRLYKDLTEKKQLPDSDNVPLPFSCVCLVGQTEVLDPEQYPALKWERSQTNSILGREDFTWAVFSTIKNTICWFVIQFLNKNSSKHNDSFRNSEWGPEAAEVICKEVRHFKVPGGKDGHVITIGELIDKTPKNLISKVMLEEKLFDTWYGGRTVLIGDACHKLSPAAGAGALSAILNTVALANWICSLEEKEPRHLEAIFKEYKAERYPIVKTAFATSQMFKNIGGKVCISFSELLQGD
ncbi:hypothetical protein CPB97_002856 [Podila verticillata]|nr:hypothetical protein CPB97_002856 [Podila verticillata]